MDHVEFVKTMDHIMKSGFAEFEAIYLLISKNSLDIHQQARILSWLSWSHSFGIVLFHDGEGSVVMNPDSHPLHNDILNITDQWEDAWTYLFELDMEFSANIKYVGNNDSIKTIFNLYH